MIQAVRPRDVPFDERTKATARQVYRDRKEKFFQDTVSAFWVDIDKSLRKSRRTPDQPFRFMDLPAELRHMIFRELLVMPGPIHIGEEVFIEGTMRLLGFRAFAKIDSVKVKQCKRHPNVTVVKPSNIILQSTVVNIFQVSKSIREESMPIYYRNNVFDFGNLTRFERFITNISAGIRWQLTKLNIVYEGKAPLQAIKHLVECPRLRELTIGIHRVTRKTNGVGGAPHVYSLRGMGDLLMVRGLEKVQVVVPSNSPSLKADPTHILNAAATINEQVQVLLQPHNPRWLKKLAKRDFPDLDQRMVLRGVGVQ